MESVTWIKARLRNVLPVGTVYLSTTRFILVEEEIVNYKQEKNRLNFLAWYLKDLLIIVCI